MSSAALLYDRLTIDEAELLVTASRRGLEFKRIFTKNPSSLVTEDVEDVKVVVNRCESKHRALEAAKRVEELGRVVINSYRVESLCSDKIKTIRVLEGKGVKVPKSLFKSFPKDDSSIEEWITEVVEEAESELGYPLVFKPTHGSWGRGVLKVGDRETLVEVLGRNSRPTQINPEGVFLQEYVEKPGFDLRILVYKEGSSSGLLCCIARVSRSPEEFRTNTHLGGLPVGVDLNAYPRHRMEILRALDAIMGHEDYGIVALDAMPSIEGRDWSSIYKLAAECISVYDEIRRFVHKNRFRRYVNWKTEMEEMFRKLKELDTYKKLSRFIDELLADCDLKIHEANSRFDYAFNTRNATGVNPADKYVDICFKILEQ
ncbi:ATP-grasp domain-containing protein [Candidatus Bathyarchaeota archaeon]|nr:ATP-grasp domain-containing protein [Candidatus Bathyarchaeota archaeon]